jgi:hypothetical protein
MASVMTKEQVAVLRDLFEGVQRLPQPPYSVINPLRTRRDYRQAHDDVFLVTLKDRNPPKNDWDLWPLDGPDPHKAEQPSGDGT